LISSRKFHPWEGGEGKVPAQYQICRLGLARQALADKDYQRVVQLMEETLVYPENLGEGKLYGAQENDFYYIMGLGYEGLGNNEKARDSFKKASKGLSVPSDAMFYNDQKPDKIFYQGLALLKLGDKVEARSRFNKLIAYGEQTKQNRKTTSVTNTNLRKSSTGHGIKDKAVSHLKRAFGMNLNHQGVQIHLEMGKEMKTAIEK
jgi:tetratricopeptide (TPR) repeat protein